jgi:S1-C subfamily serine protease
MIITDPKTGEQQRGAAVGAGVIINSQFILTVQHLINDNPNGDKKNNFIVHTNDERSIEAELYSVTKQKLSSGETVDLMVLKLASPLEGYPAAKFSCVKPQIGDSIHTIGTPQGFPFMIQFGNVAKLRLPKGDALDDRYVVDMSIFHGNSGGPVFDSHGFVVGLSDAILYWEDEFGKHPSPIALIMSPVDMCNFMDSLNIKYSA